MCVRRGCQPISLPSSSASIPQVNDKQMRATCRYTELLRPLIVDEDSIRTLRSWIVANFEEIIRAQIHSVAAAINCQI